MSPLEMLVCAFIMVGIVILGMAVIAFNLILIMAIIIGVYLIYDFCYKKFNNVIISLIISMPLIVVWMVIGAYVVVFCSNIVTISIY